jgi:hypothetical protein
MGANGGGAFPGLNNGGGYGLGPSYDPRRQFGGGGVKSDPRRPPNGGGMDPTPMGPPDIQYGGSGIGVGGGSSVGPASPGGQGFNPSPTPYTPPPPVIPGPKFPPIGTGEAPMTTVVGPGYDGGGAGTGGGMIPMFPPKGGQDPYQHPTTPGGYAGSQPTTKFNPGGTRGVQGIGIGGYAPPQIDGGPTKQPPLGGAPSAGIAAPPRLGVNRPAQPGNRWGFGPNGPGQFGR